MASTVVPWPRRFASRSNARYTTGVVNSVSAWLQINPPTIAIPNGLRNSAPVSLSAEVCQRQTAKHGGHGGHEDGTESQQSTPDTNSVNGILASFAFRLECRKSIIMMAFF